jgi:hypothetical protein
MTICLKLGFLSLLLAFVAHGDEVVYTDNALADGWQDWSWSSTISYDATDMFEGTSSISVTSQAWSALSLKAPSSFSDMAGLKFDVSVNISKMYL